MLLFFILFVPLFVLILLGVHTLVATSNPDPAKLSGYECGFSSVSDARQKFQVSFFLVAILFIVFDLEILFIYPLVISLYHVSYFGFWIAMVFVLLLTVGLVYELCSGESVRDVFEHATRAAMMISKRKKGNCRIL
jgi:NADH-quinone oxidoreductase subunit A